MAAHRLYILAIFLLLALATTATAAFTPTLRLEKQEFAHDEYISVFYNTPVERKRSYDWIGIFLNGTCIQTFDCYLDYDTISATFQSQTVTFSSKSLPVGTFSVRYIQKDSLFGPQQALAAATLEVTNLPTISMEPLSTISNPGDEVIVKWTSSVRDYRDFIGLFLVGSCPTLNDCYFSRVDLPDFQVSGQNVFKLPQLDQQFFEFRYIRQITVNVATSRPVLSKQDTEIIIMHGTSQRNDTLYGDVNKYLVNVADKPANALLTMSIIKNSTACADKQLNLLVKHGEMPTDEINDFKQGADDAVVATFAIDSTNTGRWYFTVSYASTNELVPCQYTLKVVYFLRCPNDCSQHGTCNNGTCVCSAGYSKADCSKGLTPFNPPSRPFRPLLLLPGVAGTSLDYFQDDGSTIHSWVNIDNVMAGLGWKSRNKAFVETIIGLYNLTSDIIDPLKFGPKGKMKPNQGNFGLEGISCLLSDRTKWYVEALHLKSALGSAYYYDLLIQMLTDYVGYIPGKTLFGFGYDWRLSNKHQETVGGLRTKIQELYNLNKTAIDVFTHSMGGLVMKSYVALYPQEAARYVRSWTVAGTPHHGASKAIDAFIGGYSFDNPLIAIQDALGAIVNIPSAYELFVDPHFSYAKDPTLSVTYVNGETDKYTLRNVSFYLDQILNGSKWKDLSNHEYDRPYSNQIFARSEETRKIWREMVLPPSIKFYNIYGDTIPTVHSLAYNRVVSKLSDLRGAPGNFSYVNGDRTVWVESAYYDGLNAKMRIPLGDVDHMNLVRDERVFKWLRDFALMQCPIDGWWQSTEFVGYFFKINQIGRKIHFKAAISQYTYEFEGYYEGGLIHGDIVGTDYQFVFNMSTNCLMMDAVITNNSTEIYAFTIQRNIGSNCFPQSVQSCYVEHGTAVRRCYYGYFASTCEITSCDDGYCPQEDPTYDHYSACVPCKTKTQSQSLLDQNLCPPKKPYLCNATCAESIEECNQYIVKDTECSQSFPIFCDNRCVKHLSDCSFYKSSSLKDSIPWLRCPKDSPFLAHDGKTCCTTEEECDKLAPKCSLAKPYACDNGKCVENKKACSAELVDKPKALSLLSKRIQEIRPMCPADKPFKCSNGRCAKSLMTCGAAILASSRVGMEEGSWKFYHVDHASKTIHLTVKGDAEVFVKKGDFPSYQNFDKHEVASSDKPSLITICADSTDTFIAIYSPQRSEARHHSSIELNVRYSQGNRCGFYHVAHSVSLRVTIAKNLSLEQAGIVALIVAVFAGFAFFVVALLQATRISAVISAINSST